MLEKFAYGHLRDRWTGKRLICFELENFLTITSSRDPAYPKAWSQRLGNRSTKQDQTSFIVTLRAGRALLARPAKVTVNVVFNQWNLILAEKFDDLLLLLIR